MDGRISGRSFGGAVDSVFRIFRVYGRFIWQFCDVRVSSEWFAGRPREMNNKGIVDEYRRPKLAYEKVKEIFQKY